MPQIQPYPPVCPQCQKGMKLMLEKESGGGRKFQCVDCGETDPMQDLKTNRWLNGELREKK
jgi:Zn ribbon nucleic-acid-binding protein